MRRLPLIGLFAVAPLLACEGDASHRRDAGNPESAARVISLIPSATEIIVAIGAADRLVARTEFDEDPRLADLPSVGKGLTPSLEQLVSLHPDLVITWPDNASRSLNDRLADLGVTIYTPASQTLEDIYEAADRIGELLGLEEKADSLVVAIQQHLDRVGDAVAGLERPTALYVVWHEPPTVAGPHTYIDELIAIAGGRNVFDDAPGLWPQVSIEEVVRRGPDIVLVPLSEENPLSPEILRDAPGWRQVAAVRDGRITSLDGDLFNRPGPRVGEAAARLARVFHPRAFPPSLPP